MNAEEIIGVLSPQYEFKVIELDGENSEYELTLEFEDIGSVTANEIKDVLTPYSDTPPHVVITMNFVAIFTFLN